MMANEQRASGPGEAHVRQRRLRYFAATFVPGLAAVAVLYGVEIAMGYKPFTNGSTLAEPLVRMDATFAVIFSVVLVLAVLSSAIWFHRVTDEQDERAILWGNTVGFYSLCGLALVADALTAARLIPALSHTILLLLCLVPAVLAYFWVKFR